MPELIPPAAITGIFTSFTTLGIKHNVVVSSLPLWPPASNPSTTIASTPAYSAFCANLTLDTTWTTFIPLSYKYFVHSLGFPAEVKTIFTLYFTIKSIYSCAYFEKYIGIFTA